MAQRLAYLPLFLGLLLVAACGGNSADCGCVASMQLIAPLDAELLVAQNQGNADFVILDVRTPAEFALGHLAGAINIDFLDSGFEPNVSALARSGTILVHCKSGGRSAGATDTMFNMGFLDLYDLDGGFDAWVAANLPWTTN